MTQINRRRVIQGTAAVGALALPAGAAVAATDADPGLAQLEAGYARWQEMRAEHDTLEDLQYTAFDRAAARLPEAEPEPLPPDHDVERLWHGPSGLLDEARDPESYVVIPQELLDRYDAYREEHRRWRDRQPTLHGDPDYQEAKRIERQGEALWWKAFRLRGKLLKIPTTSPRGLLIKVALATETARFADFDKRFRRASYYGTFDGCGDLMAPLLADLRAMVGRAVA